MMRALRSVHKKLLTIFLVAYFTVLFVSIANLNMKELEPPRTSLLQASPYTGSRDKELHLPLYPSDKEDIAEGFTSFRLFPFQDSRRHASTGLLLSDIISQTKNEKSPFLSHIQQHPNRSKEEKQHLQQSQQKPSHREDTSDWKGRENFILPAVDIHQKTSTQMTYAYRKAELGASEQRFSLQDTAQANELLFQVEQDFPGLKNFQPDPLVKPFEVQDQSNTNINGNFIALGREAYVYSAYLDERKHSDIGVFVRVIALLSQKSSTASLYSHSETDGMSSAERCVAYEMCENHGKFYGGYIFSCPFRSIHSRKFHSSSLFNPSILISMGKFAPQIRIPFHLVRPDPRKIVFLDSYPSQNRKSENWYYDLRTLNDSSSTNTEIFLPPSEHSQSSQNQQQKQVVPHRLSFAACVSPLFGDISRAKLVEFIELSRLLGAEHFYMYNFSIPASVSIVLEYYKNLGLVTVLPFEFPAGVRNTAVWYHGQLLANNDCLYRSMPHYDLVAFNDLDEFIIPRVDNARTWQEAFSSMLTNDKSGFSFQSAFFDNGVPLPLTMDDGGSILIHDDNLITARKTTRTKMFSKVSANNNFRFIIVYRDLYSILHHGLRRTRR